MRASPKARTPVIVAILAAAAGDAAPTDEPRNATERSPGPTYRPETPAVGAGRPVDAGRSATPSLAGPRSAQGTRFWGQAAVRLNFSGGMGASELREVRVLEEEAVSVDYGS